MDRGISGWKLAIAGNDVDFRPCLFGVALFIRDSSKIVYLSIPLLLSSFTHKTK